MEEIYTPVGGKTNSFCSVSSRMFLLLPFQWFFSKRGRVSSQHSKIGELQSLGNSRAVSQISSLLFGWSMCLKILAILASLISDLHPFNWGEGWALPGFSFPAHWLEAASRQKAGATVRLTFLSPFPQRSQMYFASYPVW